MGRNAQSSGTKLYLQAFKNMIKEKSGIDPSNFPTSNLLEFRTKIEKISNVWINNIVPLIEDSDTSNYGKARSEITKTQSKDPSMTVFLNSQSAVCRELSIIGSLLFSEYGIDTQVQSGTLKNQGGHAWLEIMNPNNKNNILAVLDSNYTRKLHPSKNDYMEKMSHPIELLPQKIVKLHTAQSIKFTL